MALDCAERLQERNEHDAKLWTAVSRLQKLTAEQKKASLKTDAAVATFDEKLANLTKTSDKLGASISDKVKSGLSMEQWAEFLNVKLLNNEKNSGWDAAFTRDLKAAKGLRHDSVVAIVKKLVKAGCEQTALKASCKASFPHSEYFK